MVIGIPGASQHADHLFRVAFTLAQLPWPRRHPKHLANDLRLPQELLVHPDDANSRHLTVCKVSSLQTSRSPKLKRNSSTNSSYHSPPKNGRRISFCEFARGTTV